jgi:hypothetical protein
MSSIRRKAASVTTALVLATGLSLSLSAAPAHAAYWTRTMWSHGNSYNACMAANKVDVTAWKKQGKVVQYGKTCTPNPYRSGWWRVAYKVTG